MFGGTIHQNTLLQIQERMTDPRFRVFDGEFKIEDMTSYVASEILAQNLRMQRLIELFCGATTKRDWGGWIDTGNTAEFESQSEGRLPNMITTKFDTTVMSAPWRRHYTGYGFTKENKRFLSGIELKSRIDAIKRGDTKNVTFNIARRLLDPATIDFVDAEIDNRAMKSYGLANGDTMKYPTGIYGQQILTGHSQFFGIAGAALAGGDIDRAGDGLVEHGNGAIKILIHWNDLPKFSALGADWAPVLLVNQVDRRDAIVTELSQRLSQNDLHGMEEKLVGTYKSIEVYACRSYFAGYAIFLPVTTQTAAEKPLKFRVFLPEEQEAVGSGLNALGVSTFSGGEVAVGLGDLTPETSVPDRNYEFYDVTKLSRAFGIGTSNRLGCSVLSLNNTVANTYLVPTNYNTLITPN